MSEHHHHHHGHDHGHASSAAMLSIAVVLTLLFSIVEAFGGYYSNSLALLGDAGHMGSDAIALAIALFATILARRPATASHSYGWGRVETLAALFSSLLMIAVAIFIVVEAIKRFQVEASITPVPVMIIALLGLLVNILIAWLLSRGQQTLNVRAALLHVVGDILGSIAALTSGIVIYFTHWMAIDPLLSIFIALLITISSVRLLREGLRVLMEGVPLHVSVDAISTSLSSLEDISSVHHVHIWTLSSGKIALSAHIQVLDLTIWDRVFSAAQQLLKQQGIAHITLQHEVSTMRCEPCDDEV
jgi:cobalt-zinc-cadmium efflux system protein